MNLEERIGGIGEIHRSQQDKLINLDFRTKGAKRKQDAFEISAEKQPFASFLIEQAKNNFGNVEVNRELSHLK